MIVAQSCTECDQGLVVNVEEDSVPAMTCGHCGARYRIVSIQTRPNCYESWWQLITAEDETI